MSARHLVHCTTPVAGCSQDETNTKEEKAQGYRPYPVMHGTVEGAAHRAGPTSH